MGKKPTSLSLDGVRNLARAHGLAVIGAFHPGPYDGAPEGTGTLVLLGPHEPGFWDLFRAAPEFAEDQSDPLDNWSLRVINGIAARFGGRALFPFGGPPYAPFNRWAARTGRAWPSPVGLMVHDTAGLWLSCRGAIALPDRLALPASGTSPCETCRDQPCRTACPVGALTGDGYDLAACHSYLDSGSGQTCMQSGCAGRQACPVSQSFDRLPAQSAFHMKAFHP